MDKATGAAIAEIAVEIKAWRKVLEVIEQVPKDFADALKENGDELYG